WTSLFGGLPALGHRLVHARTRLGQRAHSAAFAGRVGTAKSLVGPGLLVIDDACAAQIVERLAANVARDDRLADQGDRFGLAIVFRADAAGLDGFEFLGVFLPDMHEAGFLGRGSAILVTLLVLA